MSDKYQRWHDRWEEEVTPWHMETFHPVLLEIYEKDLKNFENIVIPLCGKSKDLIFFKEKNKQITGIEISRKACEIFIKEEGLQGLWEGDVFISDNLRLVNKNVFDVTSSELGKTDLIFDRACYIALERDDRKKLSEFYQKNLEKNGKIFLDTIEYDDSVLKELSPPYSVSKKELDENFSWISEKQIIHESVCEHDRFKEKGISKYTSRTEILKK